MKRYQLKQKVFTLGDSYKICDENGEERASVRSQLFACLLYTSPSPRD